MRRSAAGRAGGRSAHGAAVLVGLLAAPLVALGPAPAAAAPGNDPPSVTEDDAGDPDRPVEVELTRLEPRTLSPDAVVTMAGTLTNTGTETLSALDVRLQRGELLDSRAELLATDADPDPTTAVATPFQPVPGELGPGESTTFVLTTDPGALQVDRAGVYPVLLNLNAAGPDGTRRRVGELATFLVQPPPEPASPTSVAWLWPLVERTHRDASGRFVDDGLAEEVSTDGRLDRALAAVERLPEAVPPAGGDPAPVVPVTLAVDPALVEELELMAEGPYDVAGREDAGEGSEAAAAFLDRLRAVAADHPVVALPYGDVDADALSAAGLAEVVTRSLPGAADAGPGDGPAGDAPTGAGAEILRDALGVTPRTDLAWAVGGSVRPDTLATLRAGGVDEVVLGPHGLTGDATAGGPDGGDTTARTTVPTAAGEVTALVADSGLSGLVGAAPTAPGGTRAAAQRYLAELVLLGMDPGADPVAGRSVLVAPAREVDVDPAGASAMIAASAQLPWLRPTSMAQLGEGPASGTGQLAAPADPGGLEPEGLADVAAAVGARDDLAAAVAGEPAAELARYDAAVSRAASAAWRDDPEAFRVAAADVRATLEGLRGQVTLLAPADGTYSLASADAPLVLTVQNELPFAVRVHLRVQTRGNALTVADIGEQVLAPDQRTTLEVPAEVHQSGRFGVVATLVTPDGAVLGEQVELQVRSTAYGSISLLITIGAAALLGLLFLRRLVRYLLRRRAGTPPAESAPPAPLPPTRSPV